VQVFLNLLGHSKLRLPQTNLGVTAQDLNRTPHSRKLKEICHFKQFMLMLFQLISNILEVLINKQEI